MIFNITKAIIKKQNNVIKNHQKIFERQQRKQSIDVGVILNCIGGLYFDSGNYENALQYFKKSIQIKEKINEKQSIEYSDALMNISVIQYYQDNLKQALQCFEECLTTKIKIKREQGIESIRVINNIAAIHKTLGNFDKAISQYQRALKTLIQEYGQYSIENTYLLNNLGNNYYFFSKSTIKCYIPINNLKLCIKKYQVKVIEIVTMNQHVREYIRLKKIQKRNDENQNLEKKLIQIIIEKIDNLL